MPLTVLMYSIFQIAMCLWSMYLPETIDGPPYEEVFNGLQALGWLVAIIVLTIQAFRRYHFSDEKEYSHHEITREGSRTIVRPVYTSESRDALLGIVIAVTLLAFGLWKVTSTYAEDIFGPKPFYRPDSKGGVCLAPIDVFEREITGTVTRILINRRRKEELLFCIGRKNGELPIRAIRDTSRTDEDGNAFQVIEVKRSDLLGKQVHCVGASAFDSIVQAVCLLDGKIVAVNDKPRKPAD